MICMGKKPIVSLTYENERISIKNSFPYLKCVLRPLYVQLVNFLSFKTLRLVRISLLITAITMSSAFFLGKFIL